jgi:hypothetical protein
MRLRGAPSGRSKHERDRHEPPNPRSRSYVRHSGDTMFLKSATLCLRRAATTQRPQPPLAHSSVLLAIGALPPAGLSVSKAVQRLHKWGTQRTAPENSARNLRVFRRMERVCVHVCAVMDSSICGEATGMRGNLTRHQCLSYCLSEPLRRRWMLHPRN